MLSIPVVATHISFFVFGTLAALGAARRAMAQLRARLNHFYVISRLETPSADGARGRHDGPVGGANTWSVRN
jgi:hypothetical protein